MVYRMVRDVRGWGMVERADLMSILKEGAEEVEWDIEALVGEPGMERGIEVCLRGKKEEVVRPDLIVGKPLIVLFQGLASGLTAYMIKVPMGCSRPFGIACTLIPKWLRINYLEVSASSPKQS